MDSDLSFNQYFISVAGRMAYDHSPDSSYAGAHRHSGAPDGVRAVAGFVEGVCKVASSLITTFAPDKARSQFHRESLRTAEPSIASWPV
jgi:hypothetical protein